MNEINTNIKDTAELEKSLAALTAGLSFPSETDAPIETVSAVSLKDLMDAGGGESSPVTETSFEDFRQMYGTEKDWQNDIQRNFARQFGAALALLENESKTVKILRRGGTRASVYIVGETVDGQWRGLKTTIVET